MRFEYLFMYAEPFAIIGHILRNCICKQLKGARV